MAKKRASVEFQITHYFQQTDLPLAESMFGIVDGIMKSRRPQAEKKRGPGRPKGSKPTAASTAQEAGPTGLSPVEPKRRKGGNAQPPPQPVMVDPDAVIEDLPYRPHPMEG